MKFGTAIKIVVLLMGLGLVFLVSWNYTPVVQKVEPGSVAAAIVDSIQADGVFISARPARIDSVLLQVTATDSANRHWAEALIEIRRGQAYTAQRVDRILCTMNPCDPACPHRPRQCAVPR